MENNKKDASVENDEQDKQMNTSPVAKPTGLSDDDLDVATGGVMPVRRSRRVAGGGTETEDEVYIGVKHR